MNLIKPAITLVGVAEYAIRGVPKALMRSEACPPDRDPAVSVNGYEADE